MSATASEPAGFPAEGAPAEAPPVVAHVGITVSDLERSVAFYRDVIGLTLEKVTPAIAEGWFDTLTENPGSQVSSAMFVNGALHLQLVEYHRGGSAAQSVGHAVVGDAHLCLQVRDVDDRHRAFVAGGAHRVSPMVHIPGIEARSFYVYDPDGIPVEIQEPPGTSRQP